MESVQSKILKRSNRQSGPTYWVALFTSWTEWVAAKPYTRIIVAKYIMKRPEKAFS